MTIEVHVEVLAGQYRGIGLCLVDGPLAAVDLPGIDRPSCLPTAMVPGRLAGLVELGPRPHIEAPGHLIAPAALVDRLADGEAPPASLPPAWATLLTAVASGLRSHWRVTVATRAGVAVDELEVLDAGAAGLWAMRACPPDLVAAEGGADEPMVLMAPTTATAVWVWLSRLADA